MGRRRAELVAGGEEGGGEEGGDVHNEVTVLAAEHGGVTQLGRSGSAHPSSENNLWRGRGTLGVLELAMF